MVKIAFFRSESNLGTPNGPYNILKILLQLEYVF